MNVAGQSRSCNSAFDTALGRLSTRTFSSSSALGDRWIGVPARSSWRVSQSSVKSANSMFMSVRKKAGEFPEFSHDFRFALVHIFQWKGWGLLAFAAPWPRRNQHADY